MNDKKFEWKSTDYYFFGDDLENYPDAWCFVVWSRRGPGKTYSALRFAYETNTKIIYLKRTIDDVQILCNNKNGIDTSPYVPICRDGMYHIEPQLIGKGIGGFYDHFDGEGKPDRSPFSYVSALNSVKSIKGMDLSNVEWVLLDEFIPQQGEIVRHAEGDMLLDFYMTVSRDREKRGRDHLKLILFANAENISTPITQTLEIIDEMYNLQASGDTHLYLEDRGILLHHITEDEVPIKEEEKTGIYAAMLGTAWGDKTFGGNFSGNDFSNLSKKGIKKYVPLCGYHYKGKDVFIYRKDEFVHFSYKKCSTAEMYNLDTENGQRKFYYDWIIDLRSECAEGKMSFESYTMYDLLINYRKYFKL